MSIARGAVKYKDIAERLERDILASWGTGKRLPGIRQLAEKEHVSLITARNVYLHLNKKGLVEIRQGSGTYVAGGVTSDVIEMADIRPPEEFFSWHIAYLPDLREGIRSYDPPEGFEPLREKASQWLKAQGIEGMPLITTGSQQALFLAGLAVVKEGTTVVIEDPGYEGARRIFESLGAFVKLVPYLDNIGAMKHLEDPEIDLVYTMPQGHIPTGKSIPRVLRERLLELAETYDFYIIEDDPLSDLLHESPLKARDSSDRVIYIKSLSNILGPGIRIGFCVVPEDLYPSILRFKEVNDLTTSGILQRMLFRMLDSNGLEKHLVKLRSMLDRRKAYARDKFNWSTGGVCLWIKTRTPARIHMERLLDLGVRITPGDIYGPAWSNHMRISIITPSEQNFIRGMDIVYNYLDKGPKPDLMNMF